MKSLVSALVIAAIVFTVGATSQEKRPAKKPTVSFSNDVYPIMKKRCLPCHASDSENPSELFMESFSDLMKGGKHGKPIIPKNGEGSVLIQKINPNPPFGEQMPLMTKKKLTDEEIDLFKTWIDQGAKKN